MTATITLQNRRHVLPIHNEAQMRLIADAVANQTGETFRVRRPTPDGRKVVTVFTTSDVVAIDANGINFTDLPSPVSVGEVAA